LERLQVAAKAAPVIPLISDLRTPIKAAVARLDAVLAGEPEKARAALQEWLPSTIPLRRAKARAGAGRTPVP
jgi:hypothetical protein